MSSKQARILWIFCEFSLIFFAGADFLCTNDKFS